MRQYFQHGAHIRSRNRHGATVLLRHPAHIGAFQQHFGVSGAADADALQGARIDFTQVGLEYIGYAPGQAAGEEPDDHREQENKYEVFIFHRDGFTTSVHRLLHINQIVWLELPESSKTFGKFALV